MSDGDILPDLIIEITSVSTIPAIAAAVTVPAAPPLPDTGQTLPLLWTMPFRLLKIFIAVAVGVLVVARHAVVDGGKHGVGETYRSIRVQVVRRLIRPND